MLQGGACDWDIGTVAVQTLDTYLKENIDRCIEALAARITAMVECCFYLRVAGLVRLGSPPKTILVLEWKLMLHMDCADYAQWLDQQDA